jgi:hypothetical protein
MIWEYKTGTIYMGRGSGSGIQEYLKSHGKLGWELVSMANINPAEMMLFFKRPDPEYHPEELGEVEITTSVSVEKGHPVYKEPKDFFRYKTHAEFQTSCMELDELIMMLKEIRNLMTNSRAIEGTPYVLWGPGWKPFRRKDISWTWNPPLGPPVVFIMGESDNKPGGVKNG